MLSLSQTVGYAIEALTFLKDERACLIRQVSASTGIGRPYLAKIISLLVKGKLIRAKRGFRGGILLARPANQITLLQIIEAVERNALAQCCLLGMRQCNEETCPIHGMWVEMNRRIREALGKITLAEVGKISEKQGRAIGLPGGACRSGKNSVHAPHPNSSARMMLRPVSSHSFCAPGRSECKRRELE